jgi:hypothetical protein
MDDKKYADGGFVDIPNICYHSDNSRLDFEKYCKDKKPKPKIDEEKIKQAIEKALQ